MTEAPAGAPRAGFALLFSLQGRRLLHADDVGTVLVTVPARQPLPSAGPLGRPPPTAIRAAVLALVVAYAFVRALARRRGR